MEYKGKVTRVALNGDSINVSVDVSDYRDGQLYVPRHAQIDVPLKYASAYHVGREIVMSISPVEK
jgi:hypothetical protein